MECNFWCFPRRVTECKTAWDRPTYPVSSQCNLNQNKLKPPSLSSPRSGDFYFHSAIEWKRSRAHDELATSAKVPELWRIDRGAKDFLVLGNVFVSAAAQFRIRVGTWRYGLLLKDTRAIRFRSKRGAWNPTENKKNTAEGSRVFLCVRVCECRSLCASGSWLGSCAVFLAV